MQHCDAIAVITMARRRPARCMKPKPKSMSAAEPRLRRLWGLAVVVLAALGAAAEPLHPSQVYRVVDNDGHTAYLAPGVAFAAESSLELLPGTPTLAACELACREEPDCVSFEFCETQVPVRDFPPLPPFAHAAALRPLAQAAPGAARLWQELARWQPAHPQLSRVTDRLRPVHAAAEAAGLPAGGQQLLPQPAARPARPTRQAHLRCGTTLPSLLPCTAAA